MKFAHVFGSIASNKLAMTVTVLQSRIFFVKCIWLLFFFSEIRKTFCISAKEDLTLSMKEKKVLDELKSRVLKDLPNDWMKTEMYLTTWVRAGGRNVDKAERLLRENLKWREEYKMDNILKERFPLMEEEYPIDADGVDYEGRPVVASHIAEWDIRKSHLAGQHEENYRYTVQALEKAAQKVRDALAQGKPITRFQVIFDLDGFNFQQHACIQCVPPYLKFISTFQNYYPEMVDNIIFVNAPPTIEQILRVIRPIARPSLRKILKFFGTNKQGWQSFLFKLIPRDQLDTGFGGTKKEFI